MWPVNSTAYSRPTGAARRPVASGAKGEVQSALGANNLWVVEDRFGLNCWSLTGESIPRNVLPLA